MASIATRRRPNPVPAGDLPLLSLAALQARMSVSICVDIWSSVIRLALVDAQGNDPDLANEARAWLEHAGMEHLLSRPEAARFAPNARWRKVEA